MSRKLAPRVPKNSPLYVSAYAVGLVVLAWSVPFFFVAMCLWLGGR